MAPLDLGNDYYDPYENAQKSSVSIKDSLFSTARTMMYLGALNIGGMALWGAMSRGVATTISRYGTGAVGRAALGATSIGGILKNTSSGKALGDTFKSATRIFKKALDSRAELIAAARKRGPAHAAVKSLTSVFRDKKTFAAVAAKTVYKTAIYGAPISYAIDIGLGYGEEFYGLEKKAWYDVPGKVSNFGKWMAINAVSGLGFIGAQKALGAAGAAGALQVSRVFKGNIGKGLVKGLVANRRGMPEGFAHATEKAARDTFKDETLDFAANFRQSVSARMMNRALSLTENVSTITKTINNAIVDTIGLIKNKISGSHPNSVKGTQSVGDPIRMALGQIKDIWTKNRTNHTEQYSHVGHPGLVGVEFANSLATQLQNRTLNNKLSVKSVVDHFDFLAKRDLKTTLLDEIFGLDPLRIKDVVKPLWEQEKRSIFKDKFVGNEGDLLMNHILNMRVSPGHYKPHGGSIKGGGVNLGMFDPLHAVKRMTSAVLLKPFRVPLLSNDINIGDMFGVSTWASGAPSVTFWSDRRSYKLGRDAAEQAEGMKRIFPKGRSSVSTADVTSDVWMTVAIPGKLSFFTDQGVHSMDWGRRLCFDYEHGARRGNENAWMINRRKAQEAAERGTPSEKGLVHNKWLGQFVDDSKLSWPTAIQRQLDKVKSILAGKNTQYKSLVSVLENENSSLVWKQYTNVLQSLRLHAGQDIPNILTKRGALDTIAEVNHYIQFGDMHDVLMSSRTLQAKLREAGPGKVGESWAKYLGKKGIHEEIELLQAFPSKARKPTVRGFGVSRELSLEDRVRLEYIDDVFGREWRSKGTGDHPLYAAAPKLLERGYINQKEFESLKLFSTLSSFQDSGIFGKMFDPSNSQFGDMIKQARLRLKDSNHDLQSDIIKFVSSRKLRNTTLKDLDLLKTASTQGLYNNSPFVSVSKNPIEAIGESAGGIMESVTNLMRDLVLPFKKNPEKHFGLEGNIKYLTGAMVRTAAGIFAFKALDASLAANPLLDNTALEAGVTGAVADVAASTRLGTSRVLDALGVTGVAKYLNGLMPGFTTSAPGAIAGAVVSRTLGGGWLSMAKGFAFGAIGNRILSPFLPDFTKTYEQLEDEYAGRVEVPIMKSPMWALGPTPWTGQKVEGFSPNWYVRTKSRWKETDTVYGSAFRKLLHEPIFPLGISVGDFIDPYFMERKHYFSRPYPSTGRIGEELPLVGPLVAGTLGRLLKPVKTMHQEFLSGGDDSNAELTYPFNNPPPTLQEGLGMMHHTWGFNRPGGRSTIFGTFQYKDAHPWSYAMGEEALYNVQNFAGLKGFVAGAVSDRIFNRPTVIPTLETAGRISSQARFYGDANLGGLGIFTEPVRRIVQKQDSRKYGINPIPNMMPDWLPAEFKTGDPYSKIMRGELRLPGAAYQDTHASINFGMPARASMFGGPIDHIVQYFTGLLPPNLKEEYDILETGTNMHRQIQDVLSAEGLLIQAEKLVYDVKNDITGHVDAVIRDGTGGGGRKALEIKTINSRAFSKLSGPKDQHVGQLNFYLKQLGLQDGQLMYVNRENPGEIKLYDIKYSKSRLQRDLEKLEKSRQIAMDVMSEGIGDRYGVTYSWLDRLKILADVAPHSSEYKEAKYLVESQIKANMLSEEEIAEYKTALKHKQARIRKYELYPNRFKGKVLSPDTEANIQSLNEDIRASAEYALPLRAIGAAWETFTNSNSYITNKFFAFKDPLEHYKMLKLYGKEYTPWDDPLGSFAEPALRTFLAKDNPVGGAYKGGILGYIVGGGPIGAVAGGLFGTAYGAVNGLMRTATQSVYIPGHIERQREINRYFDVLKYERFSRASQLSEGLTKQEYQDAANATLNAYNQEETTVGNLFKATPYFEKPYIAAWLEENDPDRRKEILKYLPGDLAKGLKRAWASNDKRGSTSRFVTNTSEQLAAGYNGPQFDRSLLDPSVLVEDIKLKTVKEEGLNAHDFGLGWNDQLVRLQENYNDIGYVRPGAITGGIEAASLNLSPSHVRYTIVEYLRNNGLNGRANVYINAGADDMNVVNITIKRDRSQTIVNALEDRREYLG